MTRLTLIGCGHMGSALVKGWKSLPQPHDIQVIKPTPDFSDPDVASHVKYSSEYKDIWDNSVVLLAVKPKMMREVLQNLLPHLRNGQSVITIAAGIKVQQYKAVLPDNPVTRVMPSLPAAQCQSLTAIYGDEPHLAQVLFDPLGGTVMVNDDTGIDTAAAIIGCGPGVMAAYLYAVQQSALHRGLTENDAKRFVAAMSEASISWLLSQDDYNEAIAQVGREGSMTMAMVNAMRENGLSEMTKAALTAALQRAEAISTEF